MTQIGDGSTQQPGQPRARVRRASMKPDAVGAAAVELARAAAQETGGETVGDWLGVTAEAERQVVHRFAATLHGYQGWYWAVSLVRVPRARVATVNEVVLLPGADALRAPDWVPWNERVRPGDLRPGDVVPTAEDDPRLVPGYTLSGDPAVDGIDRHGNPDPDVSLPVEGSVGTAVAREWGFGRSRVMSALGRDEAAERWQEGEGGPDSPIARQAPDRCVTCGFYLPLAGSMGVQFGACANALSPSDGRIVSLDHGCGAHSESLVVAASS